MPYNGNANYREQIGGYCKPHGNHCGLSGYCKDCVLEMNEGYQKYINGELEKKEPPKKYYAITYEAYAHHDQAGNNIEEAKLWSVYSKVIDENPFKYIRVEENNFSNSLKINFFVDLKLTSWQEISEEFYNEANQ